MRVLSVFSPKGRPGWLSPMLLAGLALAVGSAWAADQGPRRHAQGQFGSGTGI